MDRVIKGTMRTDVSHKTSVCVCVCVHMSKSQGQWGMCGKRGLLGAKTDIFDGALILSVLYGGTEHSSGKNLQKRLDVLEIK